MNMADADVMAKRLKKEMSMLISLRCRRGVQLADALYGGSVLVTRGQIIIAEARRLGAEEDRVSW